MCGIVGMLSEKLDGELDGPALERILATLKRRGPDQSGYHRANGVFLGHTRLSIIDLSSGQQPMFNEDRTLCVVFNGEIFNFQQIRSELCGLGHRFRTNSDTEVIIHSYEEWGTDCLKRFRGMFAFAMYELRTGKLFIARDRLGIKPLFYSFLDGAFLFASEMKAILAFPRVPKVMDEMALSSYFLLSYIPAPLTIYKHIRKFPAGHYMVIQGSEHTFTKYWDISFAQEEKPEEYYLSEIRSRLKEATSLRLISDVPLGAFLSGGVDSSVIVALMSELSKDPSHTFSMGYGGNIGGFLDERKYARIVSNRYATCHEELEVQPHVNEILHDIVSSFDEPFADSSTIPSYYLCKVTRAKVKVALSGLGGDELFGGYERYLGFKLSSMYAKLPGFITRPFQRIVSGIPERADGHYTVNHMKRFVRYADLPESQRYFGYISCMSRQRYLELFNYDKKMEEGYDFCQNLIEERYNGNDADNPLNRALYVDLKTYLPDDILACTDRISMWHSLEVRVPFLDHEFVEFCAKIPVGLKIKYADKKYILKKTFQEQLPVEITNHRKQGFDAPMTNWLNNDLRSLVDSALNSDSLSKSGIFNAGSVRTMIDEHREKREIHDKVLWSLLVFQKWNEIYM